MSEASRNLRRAGLGAIVAAAALGAAVTALMPAPAAARVFVGVGIGLPGPYYPEPYYGYPAPYYPPPPPAYYAPPPAYPPAQPGPQITYTNRPPFYNHAGQQCREYTSMVAGAPAPTYGTACRGSDGVWRVTN